MGDRMGPSNNQDVLDYDDKVIKNPADVVLKDRATKYDERVIANSPKKVSDTIDYLIFAHPDYENSTNRYAVRNCVIKYYEGKYQGQPKVVDTAEWSVVVKEMKKYKRIKTLILASHGVPGQIVFTNNILLSEVGSWFMNNNESEAPRIETINIEGCNIGDDVVSLYEFGKFFSASVISGYNMYYNVNQRIFDSDQVEVVENALKPIKPFLISGQPDTASEIVKLKKKVVLYYEWFSYSQESDLPSEEQDIKSSHYHSRDSQIISSLRTQSDIEKVNAEYEKTKNIGGELFPDRDLIRWEIHIQTEE